MPRILVVDDEPLVARSIAVQLRVIGMESVTVHSGEEALTALAEGTFDLVISDIDMRPMSGVELLAAIEERGITTPLVFLTGLPRTDIAERVLASPTVRGILQKPLVGAPFAAAIRRALVERIE